MSVNIDTIVTKGKADMIKQDYIREYITLAELLNYSRAAEALHISQPALSRHIVVMEEEMGARLFERNTKGVRLTEAGKLVYENLREMQLLFDKTKQQVGGLCAKSNGVLRISSPYYWTEDFLEPVVMNYRNLFPNCDIQIKSCQPVEGLMDVKEGKSDLALHLYTDNISPNIRRTVFAKEKLCVLVSATHCFAKKEHLHLSELNGEKLIFVDLQKHASLGYNETLQFMIAKKLERMPEIYYTEQIDTIGMTIKETGGVAIMPYGVRHMDRSYLKAIPVDDSQCEVDMCFYYDIENTNNLIPQFIKTAMRIFEIEMNSLK